MTRPFRAVAALCALALCISVASAQDKPKIKVGSLTIPVFAPIVVNILKARGFDAAHGFDLEIVKYPSISAYYAGLATGEVDALLGGPTYYQKLRLEGVPIKIISTGATLSDLVILTKDAGIKSIADLKGKKLAADMGSGQFQVLSIYAKSKNIDLKKDVEVVNANFAVSRAQLAAGRVDAAMVIEPIATMMKKQDPGLKTIFNANQAWQEMTGNTGWELVYAMREDSIKRMPGAPKMFIAAMQDVANFLVKDPDAADKIAHDTTKLPPGVLKAAVESKGWDFQVKPIEGTARKEIWDMFERAVKAGFHPKLPDEGILYAP